MFSKPLIIIDVDGTYYDKFKEDDKEIIKTIFKNNRFINFIDSIAWYFNSFDILSNTEYILKLRLKFYSVLTNKKISNILERYKELYQVNLSINIKQKEKIMERLQKKYTVILISSNMYSGDVLSDLTNLRCYKVKNNKERKALLNGVRMCYGELVAIVGNNYMDDIKMADFFNCKSVYIGKSKLITLIKRQYKYKSFSEFEKQARI